MDLQPVEEGIGGRMTYEQKLVEIENNLIQVRSPWSSIILLSKCVLKLVRLLKARESGRSADGKDYR